MNWFSWGLFGEFPRYVSAPAHSLGPSETADPPLKLVVPEHPPSLFDIARIDTLLTVGLEPLGRDLYWDLLRQCHIRPFLWNLFPKNGDDVVGDA